MQQEGQGVQENCFDQGHRFKVGIFVKVWFYGKMKPEEDVLGQVSDICGPGGQDNLEHRARFKKEGLPDLMLERNVAPPEVALDRQIEMAAAGFKADHGQQGKARDGRDDAMGP